MRRLVLALVSVGALAACNPSTPATETAANNSGAAFPDTSAASYRAEATVTDGGNNSPVVMIRSGRNVRVEFTTGEGPATLITNGDSGDSYVITAVGGHTIAVRATSDQFNNPLDEWQGELSENATRTGECTVAGETGAEWTKTTPQDGTDTVCVTDDGIFLRATDDGRVVWETTKVERGAQSAELFTLPEGVQVVDLGNMGALVNQAIEGAKQRGH